MLKNRARRTGAESFGDHFATGNFQGGIKQNAFLVAPWHKDSPGAGLVMLSIFIEMLGVVVFALFVNLAKFIATGADVLLDGAVLGLVAGGTYYMISGWRLHTNELPHHFSTSISFAYLLVMRTGVLILLLYWFAQISGALIAGGILQGFGAGTLPTPAGANIAITWGAEILGSGLIIFTLLYQHLLGIPHFTEDAGENYQKAQISAAWVRGLITIVLFQFQSYSFDFVIYLAGLIGSCSGIDCPNASPFNNAPVFYGLVPFLGAIGAVLLYYLCLAFYGSHLCPPSQGKVGARIAVVQSRHTSNAAESGEWIDGKSHQ